MFVEVSEIAHIVTNGVLRDLRVGMVEMADTLDSKSSVERRFGSSPNTDTNNPVSQWTMCFL